MWQKAKETSCRRKPSFFVFVEWTRKDKSNVFLLQSLSEALQVLCKSLLDIWDPSTIRWALAVIVRQQTKRSTSYVI